METVEDYKLALNVGEWAVKELQTRFNEDSFIILGLNNICERIRFELGYGFNVDPDEATPVKEVE